MAEQAVVAPVPTHSAETGDKGLKTGALGFMSSVVIGVASTAPGYSLAASLGLVVAAVGLQAPAIMWIAFVPMVLVATSYYCMNRVDPDCGTTFTWATRALGPVAGWIGGWAIIVADIVVMANLAQIAGLYTFLLFGADGAAASTFWVTFVGVIWIAVMTIDLLDRDRALRPPAVGTCSAAEIITLAIFAVVALVKVYGSNPPANSVHPAGQLAEPVRHQHVERARLRRARRRVHLLGLGQPRLRERGDRGRDPHAGDRGGHRHGHPGRHLRDRLDRGPGVPRAAVPGRQLGRRAQRCWAPTSSAHPGTSC